MAGAPLLAPAAPAAASVLRLRGTAATASVWSGPDAVVLLESRPGYTLRTLDPLTGSNVGSVHVPRRYDEVELAASPSLVAIGGVDEDCFCKDVDYWVTADDVLAASPGGVPACSPGRCGSGAACLRPPATPLVSGPTLVHESCLAEGGALSVIEDGSGGSPVDLNQVAYPQSLAGRWLVGLAPGAFGLLEAPPPVLVERDLATGAEPLRIALPWVHNPPQLSGGGEYPALAAVQEDGTIAYLLDKEGHNQLWTASPAAATPRLLASPGIGTDLEEAPASGRSLQLADRHVGIFVGHDTVAVETLDGASLGSVRTRALDGFAFDGTRVLLTATPCVESFLETWTPGEAAPVLPGGRCPAPRIGRVRFSGHRVRVGLDCPAQPPLGCTATNVSVLAGPEGSAFELESAPHPMAPGAASTITIALGRREARWLARHHGASVSVTVGAEVGERGTFRRRVRVRVP